MGQSNSAPSKNENAASNQELEDIEIPVRVSNPNERRIWGLYNKNDHSYIPLKSINASVQIINNIARVCFTQVYYNPSQDLLESEFYFPVASGACFDSFEAKFNNTTIKGVVKLKDVAKEEYKEAVSKGRMAAYSEVVEETGDIMKVLISNIPPKTDVSISFSYIEKLEMVLNKFWCFRLFSCLTPRYNGDVKEMLNRDINLLCNYPTIRPKSKDAYPWNIEVNVQTSSPLTLLKSPSHNIFTSYGNENHTCLVTLDSVSQHKPNKDFVIMFSNNDQAKVDYMLTPFEEGYCAMVNVAADFDGQSDENVYAKVEKAKAKEDIEADKISYGMNAVRGEYVFLIDRSGSMDGDRIRMASSALQLFLKSLPRDSYFNVVSFGDSYDFMHETSIKYESKALGDAIRQVNTYDADMGGTEILQALQMVFRQPLKKGYPRFVFLLTDGAVSNTNMVLNTIKQNSDTSRVFTIGIGNGCSSELIINAARNGQGKHEFVPDNADIYEKVVGLLNASLSPIYSDFSIEAANFDAVVKSVSPNPASVPFVLNGQSVTFYLFLRKEAFDNESKQLKLSVKMHDTKTQQPRTVEVVLDADKSIQNDMIAKLGINDMIVRLEEQKKDSNNNEALLWYYKKECKEALTELSLKYGILTSETAFICEISDNKDVTDGLEQKKVIVPTVLSNDYCSVEPDYNMQYYASPSASIGCYAGFTYDCEDEEDIEEECCYERTAYKQEECMDLADCAEPMADKKAYDNFNMKQTIEDKPLAINATGNSYLNVIMLQNFEGSWDANDLAVKKNVVKGQNLSNIPEEITKIVGGLAETVWMTILVLLWLEVVCANDRKAWALVHQKGCDWLKENGVEYEKVKELGKGAINC